MATMATFDSVARVRAADPRCRHETQVPQQEGSGVFHLCVNCGAVIEYADVQDYESERPRVA